MNTSVNQESAKIYEFPAGGRAALGGRPYGETISPVDHDALPVNEVVYSGSWYHEEAIRESRPEWER